MAIGDNFNDMEMLEAAGLAVVMGNAHEEMRRHPGWHVTADLDHDGVAEAMERWAGVRG
jgi:hydroxymethylpyrimidine pyrophosphatase-like HAD family hydrolase